MFPSQDRLIDFVDGLQSRGEYVFSKNQAEKTLKRNPQALQKSFERLQNKNRIVRLRRNFFAIIPVEYKNRGVTPAEWFIDSLMKNESKPYYVGLLSAARFHGAAHQQPQEFQVIVKKQIRPLQVHGLKVRFIQKAIFAPEKEIVSVKTETGYMRISSPELTALDLIRFASFLGGVPSIAIILAELGEKIGTDGLLRAARKENAPYLAQRLGAILDRLGYRNRTTALSDWLKNRRTLPVRLDASSPGRGFSIDSKWNVIVNLDVRAKDL